MPNHVTVELTLTGPIADRQAVIALMGEGETDFDFNKLIPRPKEFDDIISGSCTIDGERVEAWREIDGKNVPVTAEERASLRERFGATNWYEWCVKNWGTKWNAYDVFPVSHGTNRTTFTFTCAWSDPRPIIEELARRFPALKLKVWCSGEVDEEYGYAILPTTNKNEED